MSANKIIWETTIGVEPLYRIVLKHAHRGDVPYVLESSTGRDRLGERTWVYEGPGGATVGDELLSIFVRWLTGEESPPSVALHDLVLWQGETGHGSMLRLVLVQDTYVLEVSDYVDALGQRSWSEPPTMAGPYEAVLRGMFELLRRRTR